MKLQLGLNRFASVVIKLFGLSILFPPLLVIIQPKGPGVAGVRLTRLDVPSTVIRGDSLWLNCSYDLESDLLYSIKWFKDGNEFYRFLPNDEPSKKTYPSPGLWVDLSISSFGCVHLTHADLNTGGTFKCEVSADAPSFQTVREEKKMRVYYFPDEGPTIIGTKPSYSRGDLVNVTCIARPSEPPTTLRWYINGNQAPAENVVADKQSYSVDDLMGGGRRGEGNSSLSLWFNVNGRTFINGMLKLRCTAFISEAYSKSTEEVIVNDMEQHHASSSSPSSTRYHSEPKDGPLIMGGRKSYNVGNFVNMTCISYKSKPAAELKWFINDVQAPPDLLRHHPKVLYGDDEGETSRLGLEFVVKSEHFESLLSSLSEGILVNRHQMRLKCTSTSSKVISVGSDRETVVGSGQQSSELHAVEFTGAETSRSSTAFSGLSTPLLILFFPLHLSFGQRATCRG